MVFHAEGLARLRDLNDQTRVLVAPRDALAVTISYRQFLSLVPSVARMHDRESHMPQQPATMAPPALRRAGRLVLVLLGLTAVLLAADLVLGLTGGEDWTRVVGFVPVTIALALVGALVAGRTRNRLGWLFLAAATCWRW